MISDDAIEDLAASWDVSDSSRLFKEQGWWLVWQPRKARENEE